MVTALKYYTSRRNQQIVQGFLESGRSGYGELEATMDREEGAAAAGEGGGGGGEGIDTSTACQYAVEEVSVILSQLASPQRGGRHSSLQALEVTESPLGLHDFLLG